MTKDSEGGASGKGGSARRTESGKGGTRGGEDLQLGTDKLYFKIGEVSEIVGVAPYVLRYWETEFRGVKPQKSRAQQRVYRRRDVELLLKIKHLLYEKKFTIAGAKQELAGREEVEHSAPEPAYRLRQSLAEVREQIAALGSLIRADSEHDLAAADPAAGVYAHVEDDDEAVSGPPRSVSD